MEIRIRHETRYEYEEPVAISHHEVHLTPREGGRQTCLAHRIDIEPEPASMRERTDYFGNRARYFGIHEPHRSLRIVATSTVKLAAAAALPTSSLAWETVRDRVAHDRSADLLDAYAFTFDSTYVAVRPPLLDLALPSFAAGRPLLEAVTDLTARIHRDFAYDPQATQVSTPLSEVLEHRRGVCQDFAHLEIGCLRAVGLPARYVSGYLLTQPPPGKARLVGADASHAWVATYLPEIGWIELDPANDLVQPSRHVVVAYGRDFGDVTPLRGVVMGGGRHTLGVSVDVVPSGSDAEPAWQSQIQSRGTSG